MKTEVRGQRSEVRTLISLLLLFLLLLLVRPAHAQDILLKTNQKVETLGVRRDGDMVLGKVQVGSGSGEVGYNIAQIAKIEFPEPRGLKNATDFNAQGQPDKALAEINPVVDYYKPFKEIPGAWWTQAALIKVASLSALHRDNEAEALATEIQKTVTDPESARAIQVRLATGLIRKKEFDKAIAICDAAIKESADPEVLANAWLNKGHALLEQKRADAALLAYLHIPVFYSDKDTVMPAALLGSAKAYRRLDDNARAKKSLNQLIASFPKSAEAATAQSELKKLESP